MNPEWSFGPISGPICGALGATALTLSHPFIGFPIWLPMVLAGVGATCAVIVGVARATTPGNITFRSACWIAAGSWTVWTITGGWSWITFGVLTVGSLVAAMLAPVFAPDIERDPNAPPIIGSMLPAGLRQEWADRITRIARIDGGVTITDVDRWPGDTGYTLYGEFPEESAYTWTAVRDVGPGLAAAKRLPIGCPVTAELAGHQGGFVLHVPTVNGLVEDLPYPLDVTPTSVREEFCIGQFLDKRPTMIELYQAAGLIVGARDGGKTVLLQNITGNLVRCIDAVIWHVDLNGGGISAPWIAPWATDMASRPAVDWVANGAEEALAMATVGLAIAKDRKSRYQRLLIEENTDVLPVSAAIPEIVIVVDEGGEVTGASAGRAATRAGNALRELQRIGRAMCVNVVFSQQRATADYLPAQMKKNAKLKVCMVVEDDAEIAHLLDWNKGLRAADLVAPGCGYIRRSSREVPRQFKGFLLRPAQIAQLAIATAPLRPDLDAAAVRVGGRVYAERWERASWWLAKLRGDDVDDDVQAVDQADVESAGTEPTPVGNNPIAQQAAAYAEEVKERMRAAADRTARRTQELPDWAKSTMAELDRLPVAEPQARPAAAATGDPPTTVAERKTLVLQIVAAAGPDGMRTAEIVQAVWKASVSVTRQTVSDWLADLKSEGALVSPRQGLWVAQAAGRFR